MSVFPSVWKIVTALLDDMSGDVADPPFSSNSSVGSAALPLKEQQVEALIALFGKKLVEEALSLVDQNRIFCVEGVPSGRRVFRVTGSRGIQHKSQTGHHTQAFLRQSAPSLSANPQFGSSFYCTFLGYCSCMSHMYETELRAEKPLCKHELAVLVAKAVHRFSVQRITDRDLGDFLFNCIGTALAAVSLKSSRSIPDDSDLLGHLPHHQNDNDDDDDDDGDGAVERSRSIHGRRL